MPTSWNLNAPLSKGLKNKIKKDKIFVRFDLAQIQRVHPVSLHTSCTKYRSSIIHIEWTCLPQCDYFANPLQPGSHTQTNEYLVLPTDFVIPFIRIFQTYSLESALSPCLGLQFIYLQYIKLVAPSSREHAISRLRVHGGSCSGPRSLV